MEDNLMVQKVKKRLADWKTSHAVTGPGGKFMSFEQNKAAYDDQCSPGEFKSSAVIHALEVRSKLEPEFPSFVKSLVRSHVANCFLMGLPGSFCKSYLPVRDSTMILEDEAGRNFQVKYIAHKTGLSAGWRQFSAAHRLLEGDVLVFQLVGPAKFKVYVTRASDVTEVDGALGLLNLESHTRHSDVGKETENKAEVRSDISDKKRAKGALLDSPEKQRKHSPLRSAPRQVAEYSENTSEVVVSETVEAAFNLFQPAVPFKDIRSFDDFNIVIDGLSINPELPRDLRKRYFKLCCSQNMFLHENLIQGMNRNLVTGVISETITIADCIKASDLSTSRDEFSAWDKTLRAFQLFGMNVGFLRTRLHRLANLAYESENALDVRTLVDAKNDQVHVHDEIRNIETKLVELKEACDRFGAAIDGLDSKAEVYKSKFQEEVSAPW
ncbi:B3 domain-containing protein Os01g0234100-like isoform X2 [Momordica charantia]|nr:B3 domain-containing protein Os01g0234100-like isoform X2 [Momordica charantia]